MEFASILCSIESIHFVSVLTAASFALFVLGQQLQEMQPRNGNANAAASDNYVFYIFVFCIRPLSQLIVRYTTTHIWLFVS